MSTTSSSTLTTKTSEAYKRGKKNLAANSAGLETGAHRVAKERSNVLIAKATQKTHEQVVKGLSDLKLKLTESLDAISTQVTSELTSLKEVQEAIKTEKENLQNLHDIVAEADSLQSLLLAHKEEEEAHQKKMDLVRSQWAQDQALHQKTESERVTELQKTRQRDEDQYLYNLSQRRRSDEDKFNMDREKAKKDLEVELAKRSEEVVLREKVCAEKEQELVSLRAKVTEHEALLKKEVDKSVAVATNSLKKDLNHEHQVEKLGLENRLNLKDTEINQLKGRVEELVKQNQLLDNKYKEASDKVQAIAEKAIDGASNRQTVVQMPSQDGSESRRK